MEQIIKPSGQTTRSSNQVMSNLNTRNDPDGEDHNSNNNGNNNYDNNGNNNDDNHGNNNGAAINGVK